MTWNSLSPMLFFLSPQWYPLLYPTETIHFYHTISYIMLTTPYAPGFSYLWSAILPGWIFPVKLLPVLKILDQIPFSFKRTSNTYSFQKASQTPGACSWYSKGNKLLTPPPRKFRKLQEITGAGFVESRN